MKRNGAGFTQHNIIYTYYRDWEYLYFIMRNNKGRLKYISLKQLVKQNIISYQIKFTKIMYITTEVPLQLTTNQKSTINCQNFSSNSFQNNRTDFKSIKQYHFPCLHSRLSRQSKYLQCIDYSNNNSVSRLYWRNFPKYNRYKRTWPVPIMHKMININLAVLYSCINPIRDMIISCFVI